MIDFNNALTIKNFKFEIYYYYIYLIKLTPLFFLKNYFFLKIIFKNYIKIDQFKFFTNNNLLNINNNYKFNFFKSNLTLSTQTITKISLTPKNSSNLKNFFTLIFLLNLSLYNSKFKPNFNFKLFYIYENSKNLLIIDSNKFINRWKDSYDFLYNIYYFNFNPLIFSTAFFKKETLALNWNYNFFDLNLWNYYFPFFTFKLNKYNNKSNFFFEKLSFLNINFFLITDCTYHYKNIYYMKNNNFFTLGLVNININPWLVSYPIISFFDSFISQSFFFKFLISINKIVIYSKFFLFKKIWKTFNTVNLK